jgi:hypothetical protein
MTRWRVSFPAFLLAFLVGQSLPALDMPAEWVFGTTSDEAPLGWSFAVKNTASRAVTVTTVVSCNCLSIAPSSFSLAPGRSMQVHVTFRPAGFSGEVKNAILVMVRGGEVVDRMLAIRGTISAGGKAASLPECVRCRELEEEFQKAVAKKK